MQHYTFFNGMTGRITGSMVLGTDQEASENTPPNHLWIHGRYKADRFYIVGGQPVEKPPRPSRFAVFDYGAGQWVETADSVAAEKSDAMAALSNAVAATRRRFVTSLPGQEMIYLAKQEEARRFLAASPEPEDLSDFPLIAAEVGITAPTAYHLAQIWLFMADAWTAAAAQIEAIRLGAGASIQAANTVAAVTAAIQSAQASLAQITP